MTSDAQILAPPAAPGEGADPRRWLTLVILLLAAFMNLLDVSIVNSPSRPFSGICMPATRTFSGRWRATPWPMHSC